MATKNDVTGDSLVSRAANKNYSDGWDRIFGKKPVAKENQEETNAEAAEQEDRSN